MPEEVTEVIEPTEGLGEEQGAQATPDVEGEVSQETLPASPDDAKKLQEDINRLKSTFQSREAEIANRYRAAQEYWANQVAGYQQELEKYKTANMNDDERAQYESQKAMQEYQRQIQRMQQEMAAMREEMQKPQIAEQRRQQAIELYAKLSGLDKKTLAQHADSPEELNEFVSSYMADLRKKASASPPKPSKVTSQSGGRTGGGTLEKLRNMSPAERMAYIEKVRLGGVTLHQEDL